MSAFLFPSPIFGPVHSRRLGTSLGVNLLPESGKVCTFDCIYCECGLNNQVKTNDKMPTRELVREELERTLSEMKNRGDQLDIITSAAMASRQRIRNLQRLLMIRFLFETATIPTLKSAY